MEVENLVGLEDGELGVELGPHGREGAPLVDAEIRQRRPAEFDIVVGVVAVGPGDVEEEVLGRHAMAQLADEVVATRGADPIPGRALGEGVDDTRATGATRRTVEGAGPASWRPGTHPSPT